MSQLEPITTSNETTGAGAIDSWHSFASSIEELKTAHGGDKAAVAVEVGVTGVSAVLDTVALVMDPFGKLIAAGLGWLIEHVKFLQWPLDQVAGNPDDIKALADSLHSIGEDLRNAASDMGSSLKSDITSWQGTAYDNFSSQMTAHQGHIDDAGHAVDTAGYVMETTMALVAAVRGLLRDTITTVLGDMIATMLIALATAIITFGASIPIGVTKCVVEGTVEVADMGAKLAKVSAFGARVAGRLKELSGMTKAEDTATAAGHDAGTTTTSATHGAGDDAPTTNPNSEGQSAPTSTGEDTTPSSAPNDTSTNPDSEGQSAPTNTGEDTTPSGSGDDSTPAPPTNEGQSAPSSTGEDTTPSSATDDTPTPAPNEGQSAPSNTGDDAPAPTNTGDESATPLPDEGETAPSSTPEDTSTPTNTAGDDTPSSTPNDGETAPTNTGEDGTGNTASTGNNAGEDDPYADWLAADNHFNGPAANPHTTAGDDAPTTTTNTGDDAPAPTNTGGDDAPTNTNTGDDAPANSNTGDDTATPQPNNGDTTDTSSTGDHGTDDGTGTTGDHPGDNAGDNAGDHTGGDGDHTGNNGDHSGDNAGNNAGDAGAKPKPTSALESQNISFMKKHEDWLKSNFSDANAKAKFVDNYVKKNFPDQYGLIKGLADAKSSKNFVGWVDKGIVNVDKQLTDIQSSADAAWQQSDQNWRAEHPDPATQGVAPD
jgi:uncharacterized protein YukE